MKRDPYYWPALSMTYIIVAIAAALTAYLVAWRNAEGEILGVIIGVWLREGMGTVLSLLQSKADFERNQYQQQQQQQQQQKLKPEEKAPKDD